MKAAYHNMLTWSVYGDGYPERAGPYIAALEARVAELESAVEHYVRVYGRPFHAPRMS